MKNPITKERLQGAGVGAVILLVLGFIWPGWVTPTSNAVARQEVAVAEAHAGHCLASYLQTPGITVKEMKDLKGKSNNNQAEFLVKAKHAPDLMVGNACGKLLDRMSDDAIAAAEKKATPAAAAKG